jgi:hypothetical protein
MGNGLRGGVIAFYITSIHVGDSVLLDEGYMLLQGIIDRITDIGRGQ